MTRSWTTLVGLFLISSPALALDLPDVPRPMDEFLPSQSQGFTNNPQRNVLLTASTLPPTMEAPAGFTNPRLRDPLAGGVGGNAFEQPVGFQNSRFQDNVGGAGPSTFESAVGFRSAGTNDALRAFYAQ